MHDRSEHSKYSLLYQKASRHGEPKKLSHEAFLRKYYDPSKKNMHYFMN